MRREFPHRPAAFINAIAEEGTKAEAVEWLQRTWDELCAVRDEYKQLLDGVVPQSKLPEETALKKGDRVLVAWDSGHLEEGTVDEVTVWVKDASGHGVECRPSQLSKIKSPSAALERTKEKQ